MCATEKDEKLQCPGLLLDLLRRPFQVALLGERR